MEEGGDCVGVGVGLVGSGGNGELDAKLNFHHVTKLGSASASARSGRPTSRASSYTISANYHREGLTHEACTELDRGVMLASKGRS